MPVKYVFVTGGVVSGLGKGITAASLGRLLKSRGYKVTMQKFDPYINIDPGTMNPVQHGEVFVTDDGAETDLDLGHYERFIDESLTKNSNVTTGKIYWSVLQKERRGDFGGGTVQVIPHITNEIKSRFHRNYSTTETEIAIIEVGGTVGDIESQPFLEAIRQFQHDVGHENAILIHVTLIPYLKASGEMKTKPTQASVKELQGMGIQPDIIVCRSEHPLDKGIKEKIALFCNVPTSHVLQNLDVESLYEAPLAMEKEHLAEVVCQCLELENRTPDLKEWEDMVKASKNLTKEVNIALVGKYISLHDAYISVVESLKHAGIANSASVNIKWIDSEQLNEENADDRQHGDRHFLKVHRDRTEKRRADHGRARVGYLRELRNAGAVAVKEPENEHREDRPDGAERHETKAVGLRAAVASDVRYAETEREDERHGHRSGRHAAGVERDGEKVLIRKRREREYDRVAHEQHPAQADTVKDAHHAKRHE